MIPRRSAWGPAAALLVASCGGGLSKQGLNGDASAEAGSAVLSLRESLAGAWSFDVDGTDHSGNALALDVAGIVLATGRFGKGLQFAGDGAKVAQRPKSDPSLDLATGDFTVSFWIQFAMTGKPQFVAVKGYDKGGWFVGWAQSEWAFGLVGMPPKGGTFADPSGSPANGVFHHVVLERTGSSAQMFVDGQSVGTAAVSDAAAPPAEPFQVGGYAPGGVGLGQSAVDGIVDDVAIWHRALVAEERAYLDTHAVP